MGIVERLPDSPGAAQELAAEVWRLLLDFTWSQRGRVFGILKGLGLTPGDMKALMALEADQPRPMRRST